ncbi:type IX secretion system protein PorQ [Flavobacterium capsici]|uniref:Type IX secretion system protein PorQ n=1 Tax=Flavobacterium capsici TaxID=3075618 RepID=A0AA96EVJ0_9FLAO|nr:MULTISPECIES: type IX secretion system protein PorQ [unclassified Flavobacterium]WNM18652.1 type IX secretion system protein PorQ [Flavobacterium sp. PMR2A8]WNM22703.1 type IX secretion system protein PorQ [Flavobacterium sp. PMTSA4]
MIKKIACTLFIVSNLTVFGQVGGRSVYQFLNLVTSPRQAALGGKTITIYDNDVNQAHFNPATINAEMDNHLALNYGSYYGDVTYGTAAYAYTYDRHLQTFHAGVNYVNYGKFDGYDENGQPTSSFTGSDISLSFGYAYNIPFSSFYVGANAKLISSTLESYNSFGAAIDIGGLFIDERNDVNWALVIRNIGTQITPYAETREKLPLEVLVGVSQLMENVPIRWHLTLENMQQWQVAFSNPNRAEGSLDGGSTPEKVSFFNNALRHIVVGAELFPDKGFNLRLGYNFRRAEELRILEQRNFSGISVGIGLKIRKLKFNYSYSRYTLAANTSLFGLTIDFSDNSF